MNNSGGMRCYQFNKTFNLLSLHLLGYISIIADLQCIFLEIADNSAKILQLFI